MMDLIFEYLTVYILLFSANIGFLVRKFDFKQSKIILFSIVYALGIFILSFRLSSLNYHNEIIPIIPYILFLVSIIMLIFTIRYVGFGRNYGIENDNIILYGTVASSFLAIGILSLGWNSNDLIFSSLELAILSFVVVFLVYKISKIFNNAKRPYYGVIGEYMFLEFILLLILALTFLSVRELDYSMFGSFIILTPTYQVLYMILAIVIILVLGVLYNDWVLKRLKRK